ncbi:hypothetical protein YC2023_084390 [Brassica napus]
MSTSGYSFLTSQLTNPPFDLYDDDGWISGRARKNLDVGDFSVLMHGYKYFLKCVNGTRKIVWYELMESICRPTYELTAMGHVISD